MNIMNRIGPRTNLFGTPALMYLETEPLYVSSAPTGTNLITDYLTNSWNNICGSRELSTCQCARPAHIGLILPGLFRGNTAR